MLWTSFGTKLPIAGTIDSVSIAIVHYFHGNMQIQSAPLKSVKSVGDKGIGTLGVNQDVKLCKWLIEGIKIIPRLTELVFGWKNK